MRTSYFMLIAVIVLALGGCGLFSSGVKLEWSKNQNDPIIEATYCCGFVPPIVVLNYIPDAQLWGDGRYVWVEPGEEGRRAVKKAQLSETQIRSLLEKFVKANFFQMNDEYGDFSITDLPYQCLRVKLIQREKSVCEYYRGAPEAFHTLYDQVWSGVSNNTDFVPDRGYLSVFPVEGVDFVDQAKIVKWPFNLGFSLQSVSEGRWLDGAALSFVWELINGDTWGNLVMENGKYYQLALQIPGVSMMDPVEP